MRKILLIGVLVVLVNLSLRAWSQFAEIDIGNLPDGTYSAEEADYDESVIRVKVTVTSGRITDIKIVESRVDPHVELAKAVIDRVIGLQTVNVDAVTGATFTSAAILKAVEKALLKAMEQEVQL
ncbi:MAG: FMN-binding protein [Candidatus Omnitrophica bacterium]|nr:FMN-binding protein [Candidatus Omnitrophota bacterium]